MAEINKAEQNDFEKVGMNPFNSPTPGESLTKTPEERFAWEQPPKHNTVQPVMEEMFLQLTQKENYIELLNLLNNGTPIDQLAQVILYKGMTEGLYDMDLMMLLIEPTMYLLIAIAEENEIEPVIYEEQDNELVQEDELKNEINRQNLAKKMPVNKSSVPPSILQRVKTLPKMDEMQQQPPPQQQQEQEAEVI